MNIKNLFFSILMIIPCISNAQELDGYKNLYIVSQGEGYGVVDIIRDFFIEKGFEVITNKDEISKKRDERMATVVCTYSYEVKSDVGTYLTMEFTNMLGEKVITLNGHANGWSTVKHEVRKSTQKALRSIKHYSYNPENTPMPPTPRSSYSSWSEQDIKTYLAKFTDDFEGIYKSVGNPYFKLAILKEEGRYISIVVDTDQQYWNSGDVNGMFEYVKPNCYSTTFFYDNYKKLETFSAIDENGVLKIGDYSYIKIFPIQQ